MSYLDPAWNYEVLNGRDFGADFLAKVAPEHLAEYRSVGLRRYVSHYCTRPKPWSDPGIQDGDIWWQYARKTPFYEKILLRVTYGITPGGSLSPTERIRDCYYRVCEHLCGEKWNRFYSEKRRTLKRLRDFLQ